MSLSTRPLIAHAFADPPALLARAGRTDLVPAEAEVAEPTTPAGPVDQPTTAEDAAGAPIPAIVTVPAPAPTGEPGGDSDLATLLAELEQADAALATLLAHDEEQRRSALEQLARYDAALRQLGQAREAHDRARAVLTQAQQVAGTAFSPRTQAAARQLLETARGAAERADRLVSDHERRVGALAARPDIERALQERQRVEQARRRAAALATARTAIASGWLDEARSVLLPIRETDPDDAEVAALLDGIAREQLAARSDAAATALWTARRELRRNPESAVNRLSALELDDLPRDLVTQVFGTWLRACARLCRDRGAERPMRYAPSHGCGAVLVRESPAGAYVVLSALGMDEGWRAGRRVRECVANSAQPLLRLRRRHG